MPTAALGPADLPLALCAAECGDPVDFRHAPLELVQEFVEALPHLRMSVPFAALRLCDALAHHERAEVRAAVADALLWFADIYRERVQALLLPLSRDPELPVRMATAGVVQELLLAGGDVDALMHCWEPAQA
jgi:hypothetical protein